MLIHPGSKCEVCCRELCCRFSKHNLCLLWCSALGVRGLERSERQSVVPQSSDRRNDLPKIRQQAKLEFLASRALFFRITLWLHFAGQILTPDSFMRKDFLHNSNNE